MADIVTLRGQPAVQPPREPHAGTIEALETLLARARAGEIVGVRMAFTLGDGQSGGTIVGYSNYAMLGVLYSMTHDLADEMKQAER